MSAFSRSCVFGVSRLANSKVNRFPSVARRCWLAAARAGRALSIQSLPQAQKSSSSPAVGLVVRLLAGAGFVILSIRKSSLTRSEYSRSRKKGAGYPHASIMLLMWRAFILKGSGPANARSFELCSIRHGKNLGLCC